MQVVITGAAGFIGSHLAEACLERGFTVTGIDSFADFYPRTVKEGNIEGARRHPRFRLVEADLATVALGPLLADAEIVFHLAAQAGVRTSWGSNFDAYTTANVSALQRLLEAVKQRPLRSFVFASSSSIYGDAERLPTPESTPPSPVSPYGATKVLGEHLCGIYRRSYGVPAVALRYFSVYGPRQRPDMAFSRLIDSALNGTEFVQYGDGSQTRDFTFVADIVSATIAAGERGTVGAVYNVGGGSARSLNDAVELIAASAGSAPNVVRKGNERGDARNTAADTSVIRRELDFTPVWDFERGIAAQVEWHRARAAQDASQRQPAGSAA